MITYCVEACDNQECERHWTKIPKDTQVSMAYFKQEVDCKAHIIPKEIKEPLE